MRMKRDNRAPFFVLTISLITLFGANMVLSHLMFVTNTAISDLDRQLIETQRRNGEYRVQLARITSSETVLFKAIKLGFVENPRVLYLLNSQFAKR